MRLLTHQKNHWLSQLAVASLDGLPWVASSASWTSSADSFRVVYLSWLLSSSRVDGPGAMVVAAAPLACSQPRVPRSRLVGTAPAAQLQRGRGCGRRGSKCSLRRRRVLSLCAATAKDARPRLVCLCKEQKAATMRRRRTK